MVDFLRYVCNRHHSDPPEDGVYVGRGTPFGNRFQQMHGRELSRAESVGWYELWLARQNGLLKQVKELKGKTLSCSCRPKLCHAYVLAFVANADREIQLKWYHHLRSLSEPRQLVDEHSWDMFMPKEPPPYMINLADGKYTYIRDHKGLQTALRHGEPWRNITGDNLIASLADKVEELEDRLKLAQQITGYAVVGDHNNLTFEQYLEDMVIRLAGSNR